jgi:hypothetical protein
LTRKNSCRCRLAYSGLFDTPSFNPLFTYQYHPFAKTSMNHHIVSGHSIPWRQGLAFMAIRR